MASTFFFPDWLNRLRLPAGMLLAATPVYLVCTLYYVGDARTTDVGYQPPQPVAYSHALHVGQLGMNCYYCHYTTEKAAFAAVPPTETCLGCHEKNVKPTSGKLVKVREAGVTNKPIEWNKVHDLPDYVYFNHAVHVNRGVGCASCHARIDKQEVVQQSHTLTMGWCLNCHREPEKHLRPTSEITNMAYDEQHSTEERLATGKRLKEENNINPPIHCSTCHR